MIKEYEFHEIANLFPLMEGSELKELKEDVKKNGLITPLILYEGKILDGRNRYLVCKELEIEPKYEEFKNSTISPLDYVESMNLKRRQLNPDQRAIYEIKKSEYLKKIAKINQDQSKVLERKDNGTFKKENPLERHNASSGKIKEKKRAPQTRDKIAQKAKVGTNKIQKTKKVMEVAKTNPKVKEKLDLIEKGQGSKEGKANQKLTISKVYNEIQQSERLEKKTSDIEILKTKSDLEIFESFGTKEFDNEQPKMSDYWKFTKGDLRLGLDYPGRTWCQDTMNILYRFSKQGDLVIDPMAGGGVTIDTCKIMNRKCRGFDKKPIRQDIEKINLSEGFPEGIEKADLIILDPPYYKKLEVDYDCEDFTKDRETYMNHIKAWIANCYKKLKINGYLAFLMSNYIDYENELESIFLADYYRIFESEGFRMVLEIQSPLTFNNQYNPTQINKAKESNPWKILPCSRSWYIFKKVK